MSKAYAKTRAEEKKKNSSASSQQSSYEKSVQIYNQQKELDIQAAKRASENFTRASTYNQYNSNLRAYMDRLNALRGYGYNTSTPMAQVQQEIKRIQPDLQQENRYMQALQEQRELERRKREARNSQPWAVRVGLVNPNEAEMTFGVYDPSASERGRLSNALAAGGKGWLAGQQNALGFALDPSQPDEAEMFFGKAPTSKLGEKISGKINEALFNQSQRLYGAADELNRQALEHETAAKKGLGKFGQTLVDVGMAGTQMALDAGIGAATGTGMASMGTRTFGQSAREALDSGATYQQAMDYGMGSAAVELGTEKMFDVAKIFGGGGLDKAIEKWIVKYAKTPAGMTILRTIAGASGEGLEEIISSAVNPLLRSGYDPNALQDYKTADYWTDMLHEGLVGALLGGIGVAGNVITGGNARMVNEVNQEALNQRLQRADAFNQAQRKLFAGNTMQVGTADAEAARILNRNSGTQGARDRAAVRTAARDQYGEQAKAVESVFEAGTADAETFQRQFQTAYDLGKEGAALDVVMNTPATADLNELQRENAWLIGRDAGIREGTINEEANANGEAVRVRGSGERNPVQGAAGQVQQVEGNAGSYQEGRSLGIGRSAKDGAAADLRYSEEVKSARDLGIENGAVIKNLRTVDESSYTPEMKQYAQEMAQTGHKVTYVSGLIHAQDAPGGMITRARGMVNGNGDVFVQVDNERFTAIQIGRHEDGHLRIARGEIDLAATKDAVRESMGEERFERAMNDYAEAYAGLDMTEDEIWEEIVCDAQGEMNIFEGTLMQNAEQRASELIRETKKASQETAREGETRAPPEKTKFSMETPVEETDRLIAWHNMGVDALNGALELGGLAMPSWAIQPANKAHTQYGDVSVIAPRDLVDPKRNRNSMIFGGDAWTPVFPEVNYKVSYEAAEALEDEIKALVGEDVYRQIGGAALDKDNIADQFKRSNGRLSGHYARNLLLQYAYLKSTGSGIEAPTKEDDLYYGGDFTNEDVRRFVGRLANGKRTLEKLENMSVDELFEQDDLLQAIADVRRESYLEKLTRKGVKDDVLKRLEEGNFFKKDEIKFSTIDRMLKAARKYLDGGVQQTVDKKALQEIVDREVDQSAYEAWILQKLSDTVERKGIRNNKDLFTPSGNRRSFDQLNYAYTLANIVKAMKAQPKQGRAQFLSGPGSVRGAAMKSYKDIEQVRSESGRVIDPENYSEAPFDEYNNNLSDILDRMTKNGDKFDAADAVIEILQHAKTEQGIYNYMQRELKDWYNVSPELAHDIYELIGQVNALPIPYFEGKTYDSVRLDEALAIVVPDTISADLKKRLENAGANVLEYKAKDDVDRLRVVNSVEGAKFSRELDDQYMDAVESGDMETAQRMVDEAADRAMPNSKVRDDDGNLLHVYHGSPSERFTRFDYRYSGNEGGAENGYGHYFTPDVREATLYTQGKSDTVFSVYLNIENPIMANEKAKSAFLERLFERLPGYAVTNLTEKYGSIDEAKKRYIGKRNSLLLPAIPRDAGMNPEVFNNTLGNMGYDGVIVEDEGYGAEYIAFDSSEIKLADPITYDDDGNVIPLSERFNPEQADIRYSRELDDRYMQAVESGDMEAAQAAVDEAAKKAGYNMRGVHLSGADNITVFQSGNSAGLIYFADTESNAKKGARASKYKYDAYLSVDNPVNSKETPINWYDAEDSVQTARWRRQGHDAVYVRDEAGVSLAVFNPEQIKSADPITYDDDGNVIPLSERFNPEQADIRYSRELDDQYLQAAQSGDTETAQRMVDEAAKAAGYDTKAYHGTPYRFNEFLKSKIGKTTDYGWFGRGFYFTTDKSVADVYAGYLNDSNVVEAYLSVHNPFVFSEYPGANDKSAGDIMNEVLGIRKKNSEMTEDEKAERSADFSDWLVENGYDGAKIWSQIMILDSEQAKRTNVITYDDDGNIIPLSERFNPEKTDIRYSRETELDRLARENRALQRETDELRKAVQKWKGETKRTTRATLREQDVRKAAKQMLRDYNSKADAESVGAKLRQLGELIMNGENGEAAHWSDVRGLAEEIAEEIVNAESVNVNGDEFENFQLLTGVLKEKPIHVSEADLSDILAESGYETIGAFNKAYRGTVRITTEAAKAGDKTAQDAYYEMVEAMPGWFPEDVSEAEYVPRMLQALEGLKPVYGMSEETSANYEAAVTWAANDVIDRVLDESIRQNPKTFADRAQAKYDKERARLYQRIRKVREQGNERVERTRREYTERSRKAIERMQARQEREIQKLKDRQREVRQNERERRGVTATWHKIQRLGANFRQMVEHPAQAATKHAPRELAKALQGVADVFYTENRKRSNMTVNAAIQNLIVQFNALKDTEQGIYYDPMLAELNRAAEKNLLNIPANQMTSEQVNAVYRMLKAHMQNITNANKFVTGRWAKGIWETGREWAREVDGASPVMNGWTGDFLNWQLRPDSFFKRISGFVKDSVGERVQKMFSDGTEKMLRIQQDAYYTFRKFTESKEFDKLSKRGKKDLVDVGLKDANGKPVLLTRDMMLAVYMNLRNEQNLQAATYGGIEVPNFDEYYTGKTSTSYRHRTMTANVGGDTLELRNEQHDLQKALREGELAGDAAQEAQARLAEIADEIQQRAEEITGQMIRVRSNIANMLTEYEKEFVETAAAWMQKSADYLNAETMAMYGIEKAQVPNYWPLHRDLTFVNTDMRTITDEINLENVGFLKERVQSRAPIMLVGFTFELENHTKKVSQYCGFAAVQRDFNKLYNTKLTREGSSLERKIRDKFGDEQRKMGASAQQYIDAYIAAVSGADKADATALSVIRRNLPRATLSLNLRVAVSQLASMPTAAAEVGWGSVAKGLPRGLKTAFSKKAKNELAQKNPWFWQRYRGEGGMREFADMHEAQNWFDRFYNKAASLPVMRNLLNWCQDFDVFATASMWAMSEEWVKSNTELQPGTEEFDRAVGEKYADVIRKTQPNYTVTERSGLLRDKREGYKFLTMYKTQSNQNLNILYDANATLMKYKRDLKNGANGVTKADVKAAERQFARAYTAVIIGGSVTFAVLRAGANAILHAMNSYRDDDDELSIESVLNGILKETAGTIAGMFAFGSEIEELIMARITGDKYWGLSDSAISAVSDIVERGYKLTQGDASGEDWEKFIKSMMNVLGVPYGNAKTVVNGFVNHIEDAQNGEFLSFRSGVQHTAGKETGKIIDGYLIGAGDKVKRAWDELLKLKDGDEGKAQDAMKSAIRDAFLENQITDKQAEDMLKRYAGMKADDAAEYVLQQRCEKETGLKFSEIKEAYLNGDISAEKAISMKQKYGGMDADKAKETVGAWLSEKETGIALDDIKDAYLDGDITRQQAIDMRVKYAGKTQEDAENEALKWDVYKKYGIEYSIEGVQEALAGGEISEANAKEIWTKYGGKTEEDADELAKAANFKKAHPNVELDNVTALRVDIYEQYAPKGTDAAKFMEYAAQIRKDLNAGKYPGIPDGKGGKKAYSVMDDVARWINSLPITDGEKTALLLTYTNGKTTSLSRYNWS